MRVFFFILTFLGFTQMYSQSQEPKDNTYWKYSGNGSLTFSQVSLTNWQAGGENSVSGNLAISLFADYNRENWSWSNRLDIAYGLNQQGEKLIKTDDRLEFNSRLDRNISKHWSLSGNLNFRTQFADGVKNPDDTVIISTAFAPAYTVFGLGFTYKQTDKVQLFFSPLTVKNTLVLNEYLANNGAFGVEAAVRDTSGNIIEKGKNVRWEMGGYFNGLYKTALMENVDFQTKLDLYFNYLENFGNVDVNWETGLFMKVNKYITVNLTTNLIYDDDIKIPIDSNGDGVNDSSGPRTQFKQLLGVGFSYKF